MTDPQLQRAFSVVCVHCGFCISVADRESISAVPNLNAETFAQRVIEAEGLDATHSQWTAILVRVFRESLDKP